MNTAKHNIIKRHIAEINTSLRRQKVAELLQNYGNSITETEIARRLQCDQSTISRDIEALKQVAVGFVYALAKNDLCFYYHTIIQNVDRVVAESWAIYNSTSKKVTTKDRMLALRNILQASATKFELLQSGPSVLAVKSLNERIDAIKLAQTQGQGQQQQQGRTPIV